MKFSAHAIVRLKERFNVEASDLINHLNYEQNITFLIDNKKQLIFTVIDYQLIVLAYQGTTITTALPLVGNIIFLERLKKILSSTLTLEQYIEKYKKKKSNKIYDQNNIAKILRILEVTWELRQRSRKP